MNNNVNKLISNNWINPSSDYRSAPFWSWNGKLESDVLTRQIENMHNSGMGGFYMHSRSGLKTEYLSEEWFDAISASINKAKELGMKACLYDEDRYSSGFASGYATRDYPEFSAKILVMREKCQLKGDEIRIASFHIEFDKDGFLIGYIKDDKGDYCFDVVIENESPWLNNSKPLDMCYDKAVERFMAYSYEAYYDRYKDEFGSTIPSIFTDEIKINWLEHISDWDDHIICATYWTYDYTSKFRHIMGYSIEDVLPEIFFRKKKQQFSKISFNHLQVMSQLMIENYTQKIGQWCKDRNIAFTGHLHLDQFDSVFLQGLGMRHFEYFGWPGIDILGDRVIKLNAIKQATSVANQLGKERVVAELYGCTGWDFPLSKHKFHGDWQYVMGINYRCQHLTHYTLTGFGKKDYPASISHHSPWFKYYKVIEDYFGRLSYIMSQGKYDCETLVLCPQESLMGYYEGVHPFKEVKNQGYIEKVSNEWESIVEMMINHHIPFDFGDEYLLEKYGSVDGDVVSVGDMTYKTVVILNDAIIKESTIDFLKRSGVSVIIVSSLPMVVDGMEKDELEKFFHDRARTEILSCPKELITNIHSKVSISYKNGFQRGVWSHLRKVNGGYILFVAPREIEGRYDLEIKLALGEKLSVYELDCQTGNTNKKISTFEDNQVCFNAEVGEGDSGLFYITDEQVLDSEMRHIGAEVPVENIVLNQFDYRLDEMNALPLDFGRYRFKGEDYSKYMNISAIEDEILTYYGLPTKEFYESAQPWFLYKTNHIDTSPRDELTIEFHIYIEELPKKCNLVWEFDDRIQVKVNGNELKSDGERYIDDFLLSFDILEHITIGNNKVALSFQYCADMELQNMYITGDFGVSLIAENRGKHWRNYQITALPSSLHTGSIVGQGLDFYTGSVFYKINHKDLSCVHTIQVDEAVCTMMVLHIGAKKIVKAWGDYKFDDLEIREDDNVCLEAIYGRKNLFGPLHVTTDKVVEPRHFEKEFYNIEEYYLNQNGIGKVILTKNSSELT